MLAFSGLASKFNRLIGCHFTRVLYKYNTLQPCPECSHLQFEQLYRQQTKLFATVASAQRWTVKVGTATFACWAISFAVASDQLPTCCRHFTKCYPCWCPRLLLYGPATVLWRWHHLLGLSTGYPGSCLKLHGEYVAVEHLGWVAVFPLHDFCSRIALVLFDWWRSKDWLCYRGWLSVFPASGTGQSQRPTTGTDVSPYEQRPLWHLRMRARLARRTFWLCHWMRRWCHTQNTHENGQCSGLALSKACTDSTNVIKS